MDKAFRVAVILSAQDEMTRKITGTLDRVDQRMQRTAWQAQRIGRQMMGAGAAIGAGIALPVRNAIDFERQMAKVGAIARADAEELSLLSAEARRLGGITDRSASEAGQAMEFLSMAGLTVEQQLRATEGVIQLAGSAAVDLGSAADIATNILGGFRMEVGELSRVNDALVNTFTRSNVNIHELSESMKMVAPVAAGLGGQIEEVAAMVGLLGDVGIKGSMSGTALRAAYLRLAAPTAAAQEVLKNLNVEIEDADGNMRSMTSILADMADATKDMGNVARQAKLEQVFGQRAVGALSELLEQAGSDEILRFTEQVSESGAAARTYEQMLDNTHGGIKEMMSAAEALSITMGTQLLPELNRAIEGSINLIRTANEFAETNPEVAASIMKVTSGLALFLTVGGASVWIFGKFIDLARLAIKPIKWLATGAVFLTSAFSRGAAVMMRTGSVIKGLIVLVRALNLAFLANPVGLVVAIIAAAAFLIWKFWEPLKEFFSGFWSGFLHGIDPIMPLLKAFGSFVSTMFQPFLWAGRKVIEFLSTFTRQMEYSGDGARTWGEFVGRIIGGVVSRFVNLVRTIVTLPSRFLDLATDVAGTGPKFFSAGAQIVRSIWKGIKSMASKPVEAIRDIAGKVRDFLPFSPAKDGPLKDLHRVKIIETIARTMKPGPMVDAMQTAAFASVGGGGRAAGAAPAQAIASPVGGAGSMVVNYSPTVTINGPVGESDRQSFAEQLRRHRDELERMLGNIKSQHRRRSFE